MRILLANKFYYRRAGAEAYLLDLEVLLKVAGHEVAIFAVNHPETISTPWSKYFVRYRDYSRRQGVLSDTAKLANMVWSAEAARAMRRLIADFRPEVAHIHNLYHHLSPSVIAECRRAGVPVVQTVHDFKLVCPNYTLFTNHERCERCHLYRYWNAAVYKCLNGSRGASAAAAVEMWIHRALKIYENGVTRFITPSNFLRELLIRWGKAGEKIETINNFLDFSSLPSASPDAGEGLLYVGRLIEWKGPQLVIEAAARAPDIEFKLAGSGPLQEKLTRRAKELGLNNLRFLGALPREKVYQELFAARAVIVPSLGFDPFPTVALEAGAARRPVIGAKVGGIPEIVTHGETGLLFEPGSVDSLLDAARKLNYDPALSLRLGSSAERRVRALADQQKHLSRLMRVYAEARKKN